MTPPKISILGSGYLANKIADFLASKAEYSVVIIPSSALNYHDRKTIWRHLINEEPDIVINCSGFTGRPNIDEAETKKEECWELNVTSPLQVAELCKSIGIKHIHISSGCIYTGYEKEFTEEDTPNFGLWDESSFYSKTKHAFEVLSKNMPSKVVRLRMPISGMDKKRCYLSKIAQYDNLIDYKNSKTSINDLCGFMYALITDPNVGWTNQDIYNVVNSDPLSTRSVCELMFLAKKHNPNWNFVSIDKIPIVAPRSNCVLDNSKASALYPLRSEFDALVDCLGLGDLQLTAGMLQ